MSLLVLKPVPFINSIKVVPKTKEHPNRKKGCSRGYSINGIEGANLLVERWKTYQFELDTDGGVCPLYFTQHDNGGISMTTILGTNSFSHGKAMLTVDENFPPDFFYQCMILEDMGGRIGVKGETEKLFPPPTSWAPLGEELDPNGRFIIKTKTVGERSFSSVCQKITKHPLCEHTFHPKFLSSWLKYQKTPSDDLCPGCFVESYPAEEDDIGVEGNDNNNGRGGRGKKKKRQTGEERTKRAKPSIFSEEDPIIREAVETELEEQKESRYDYVLRKSDPKIWLSMSLYRTLHDQPTFQLVKREELIPYTTQDRSQNRDRIEKIKATFFMVGFWQHALILQYNFTTGNMWITEGHHRLIASTELELDYVPVYVWVVEMDSDEEVFLPAGINPPPTKPTQGELRQPYGIGLRSHVEPSLFGFSVVRLDRF